MNVDYAAIGQRIKQVRRSRGLTQERLAEALSVSVGYISQMERGVTKINLDTLAAVIGEEAVTIEDVYEPYLLQNGFINRTPRGRVVTETAYRHLGLEFPQPAGV